MDANTLDLRAFARVARLGSFAAAARELRISSTAISRRVAALEESLGTRLLHRTTRRVSLTPAGKIALGRVERLLAELLELQEEVASDDTPRGRIRVTAGVSLGHSLLHQGLPLFLAAHPAVSVELVLTDQHVDLVAERIDLALRIGKLADSSLIARRIGWVEHIVCAAPDWLGRCGALNASDLHSHARVVDTNQPHHWQLSGPDGAQLAVEASGRYAVNSAHAALDACRAGLGLAMLPDFVARPSLERGELANALPGWMGPKLGLYAVTLDRRWVPAAVRALVEHMLRLAASTGDP
jgi:DNA-binding transcriptional LysR family regulator